MTIFASAISRALDFARRLEESSQDLSFLLGNSFTEIMEIQLNFNPSYLYDISFFLFFFSKKRIIDFSNCVNSEYHQQFL